MNYRGVIIMHEKQNKKINVVIICLIVILLIAVGADIVMNYVPFDELFTTNVVNKTEKEVTVTDKGIADAVDKLYNATVIVEILKNDEVTGWGSGVVYKTDKDKAYILTNHHVVENAKKIMAVFANEHEVEAKVLGSDEYADVAVLEVSKDDIIEVASIGASADVRMGDTVFAIGTPISLSYSFTVTRGILSGKDRLVEMSSGSSKNIFGQVTSSDSWYASINSGNSGGPLANSNGEVIGITNSKLSSSYSETSIENIGFAIPIEDALSVASQIEETGKVVRPVLGVTMTSVEGADYNGISIAKDIKEGAVVVDVSSGSSADKAGIKKGDVITKINDYKVKDYMYLKYYLFRYRVGDKVSVTLIRDGKEKKVDVTLKSN